MKTIALAFTSFFFSIVSIAQETNGWEFIPWGIEKDSVEKIIAANKEILSDANALDADFSYNGMNTWLIYNLENELSEVKQRKTFSVIQQTEAADFYKKLNFYLVKKYGEPETHRSSIDDKAIYSYWNLSYTNIFMEYDYQYKVIDEFGADSYWINLSFFSINIIDTVFVNLDSDNKKECIVISEDFNNFEHYRFQIYNHKNCLLATLYSSYKFPWLDELENEISSSKILWCSNIFTGSEMYGEVYSGYKLKNNKIVKIISIPNYFDGSFYVNEESEPFLWGHLKLEKVTYNSAKSMSATVNIDLHKSPSWEQMDSINITLYDKTHELEYIWQANKETHLVQSKKSNRITYSITSVYEMTNYLIEEFGFTWE